MSHSSCLSQRGVRASPDLRPSARATPRTTSWPITFAQSGLATAMASVPSAGSADAQSGDAYGAVRQADRKRTRG